MNIEQTNIGDIKTGEKNGRKWTLTPCGLKINGNWHNASFVNDKDIERFKTIQTGDDIDLLIYKETYNEKEYNKFKFLEPLDLLERRVDKLERICDHLMGNADIDDLTSKETETDLPEIIPIEEPSNDLPF